MSGSESKPANRSDSKSWLERMLDFRNEEVRVFWLRLLWIVSLGMLVLGYAVIAYLLWFKK